MGIFDRFHKRPAPAGLIESLPEPRTQHYVFAHVALRELAFAKPLGVVGTLHSPDGPKFLQSLWEDVAERVQADGGPADIDASALAFRPVRVGDYPCAMITLPPALAPTECHYVAIVLHVKLGSGEEPPDDPHVSYYTLERGVTLDGSQRTVLCGWDAAGTHLNYGDGPPPDPDAFGRAVTRLAAKGGEVQASFKPDDRPAD